MGYVRPHIRQCHLASRKLSCYCNIDQCPVEDYDFRMALVFYLYGVRLPGWKKDGVEQESQPGLADIARLFPDYEWLELMSRYLSDAGERVMTKQLCIQLSEARKEWFKRFAPPGYRWRGPSRISRGYSPGKPCNAREQSRIGTKPNRG